MPELAEAPLVEPDVQVNLSATDAALEALQAQYAKGVKPDRATWQKIVAQHRDDTASRGLSEFKPRQVAQLRARYAADLERLSAMPGVALLR